MGQARELLEKSKETIVHKVIAPTFRLASSIALFSSANGIGNTLENHPEKNNNELFGEGFGNHATTMGPLSVPYLYLMKYLAKFDRHRLYANITQAFISLLTYTNNEFVRDTTHSVSATMVTLGFGVLVTNGVITQYRQQYLSQFTQETPSSDY